MFRWAAVYGVIVLAPLYFTPLPVSGAENLYGFIGTALAFQAVFWVIGSDPVRYRSLMLPAVAEKLAFGVPVMVLLVTGYPIHAALPLFGAIDLLLGLGFFLAWRTTRNASPP
jgi:hypothetical protein